MTTKQIIDPSPIPPNIPRRRIFNDDINNPRPSSEMSINTNFQQVENSLPNNLGYYKKGLL